MNDISDTLSDIRDPEGGPTLSGMRTIGQLTRGLLGIALMLGAATGASAQDSTGFLGIAGLVQDSASAGQTGVRIVVRNAGTNRTESTTTPSVANAQAGFYFIALSDFSGNRAAKVGDVLSFTAFQGSTAIGVTPATTTVSQADVNASLLKLNLKTGGTVSDKTPPEATLSYSQDAAAVTLNGALTISAGFSEAIKAGATVSISIKRPTTATAITGTMAASTDRKTFTFDVAANALSDAGTYTVSITGATDDADNASTTPKNNAFRVGAAISTPNVAVGTVSGSKGGTVAVPLSLTNISGTSVGGIQLNIAYDKTKLNFTRFDNGAALGSEFSAAVSDSTPAGTLSIVVFGLSANAIPSGDVASLSFTVASTAAEGDSNLVASGLLLATPAGAQITTNASSLSNGKITIGAATTTGCLAFDLTGDSKVNIFDILAEVNAVLDPAKRGLPQFDLNASGGNANIFDILALVNKVLSLAATQGRCP